MKDTFHILIFWRENILSKPIKFSDMSEIARYETMQAALQEENRDISDEIVQYYVVNSELNMSVGKISAQVGHVATEIATIMNTRLSYEELTDSGIANDPYYVQFNKNCEIFEKWHEKDQKKIVLRGKQKDLERLMKLDNWFHIRDNGLTEIPPNSLTVVGCLPNYKSVLKDQVKRLQLL